MQRIRDGGMHDVTSHDVEPIEEMRVVQHARCGPLFASARTNGKVALLSAKVEVRATAPGMFVTQ